MYVHISILRDFLEKNNDPKIYMATTKAKHVYSAPAYEDDEDVYIMFGKESAEFQKKSY